MATGGDSEYKAIISADPSKFDAGMKAAVSSASAASASIKAEFTRIGDSIGSVTKLLAGFTAVLAGGSALKAFISTTVEWNAEALKMSKQLGISTEQASVLNVALHHLGIESSVYTDASMKLSKQIQGNAQAFEVMGIKVRDATGAYRPVTELMGEVNEKLAAIKNPIEQNIAGQQVYGKGWAEVRQILKLTKEGMDEAESHARKLGLIVGPEGAAASKLYTEQMRDLKLVGEGVEVQFGNKLIPIFTRMGQLLNENVTPAVQALDVVFQTVAVLGANVAFVFGGIGREIGAVVAQMAILADPSRWGKGGWTAISDAVKADGEAARAELDALEKKLMGVKSAVDDAKGVGAGHHGAGADDPHYRFKEKPETVQVNPSRMGQWEADLAQRKAALERQGLMEGQYRELSKAEELKYWNDKLDLTGLSVEENNALVLKAAETELAGIKQTFEVKVATLQAEAAAFKNNTDKRLELERQIQAKYQEGTKEYATAQQQIVQILRQAADQEKQIRDSRTQAARDAQLATLALEEQTTQTALQLGLITQEQELAAQVNFENRRNAIALDALQSRLKAAELDPDRNPVEVEKIHRELEVLEEQHLQRIGAIRQQQITTTLAPITSTFASIQSSWSNLLQQVANGSLSLGGFIKGLFTSVGQAVVATLSDIAAKWAVNAILSRILSKTTAAGEIAANAGVAGAAATASAAAIPLYGWAIAPEAGAAAFASAMSYLPSISAAGGFDIPGNVNPIIQAHAREMVLPEKHADTIRSLAEGAGQGGDMSVQMKAAPMPGGFWMVHQDEIVSVIKRARRNFAL